MVLPTTVSSERAIVTRRIARALRARIVAPAWAVHFHSDGADGRVACFDERCGLAPLSSD